MNIKTPQQAKNDGMWGISTICTILKNRMYIGDMIQGKQRIISYKVHKLIATPEDEWFIVENTHDPIVSHELFEKAQLLSKRDTRTAPKQNKVYLFSGFLRFVDCDISMTKKTNRKKVAAGTVKSYVYYVFSTNAFKSRTMCSRHRISLGDLTEAVLKTIQMQVSLIGNMEKIIDEINQQPAVSNKSFHLEKQLNDKEKELEKMINVIDSLYIDWKYGDITRTEI